MRITGERQPKGKVPLTSSEPDLPSETSPVDPEEMAFAIAFFVGAANGHVARPTDDTSAYSIEESRSWTFGPSADDLRKALFDTAEGSSDDLRLVCAMSMVWRHYQGDARQQTICSRLIAFYSIMLRSQVPRRDKGAERPAAWRESGSLEPSLLRAVATAPLNSADQFDEVRFGEIARDFARGDKELTFPETSIAEVAGVPSQVQSPRLLTDIVRELAKHLYIYEACAIPPLEIPGVFRFRVLEKLCGTVTTIGGNQGLQLLLSRALAATRSEFPWLDVVAISIDGAVDGLNGSELRPSAPEALEGELALIGTLVELLRSFLGDEVTMHLLRTIWPLANLPTESR